MNILNVVKRGEF